jgi:hypothetical protein
LGGEATVTQEFNGFGCTGENNLRNYHGKMLLKELKALQYPCMTQTHQLEVDGGIRLYLIFQKTQTN